MDDFNSIYKFAKNKAKKLGNNYYELLEFEIEEIRKQGAEQYWVDLIRSKKKYSTNNNNLILPFLLDVTDIDPVCEFESIKKRLENKLDIENDPGAFKDKDMPDIDLDFIYEAREEVMRYAVEKYGSDKVCAVGLWQTYKPRSSLKDVAKSLEHKDKLQEIEKMTKELPDEFDTASLEEALEDYEEFRKWYNFDGVNKQITKYAFRLVGKIKTQGQHAGGLIISSVPLSRYLPIAKVGAKGKERWASEWTEGKNVQLSKFGFVKYDILGLKTLQYIYETCKLINKNHGIDIDWEKVGIDDKESFETANKLKTDSIFQFDTDVAKNILSKGGVKKLTDIMVYTSLGRPGPMPMIDEYILRRDSEDPNTANTDAIGYEWKEKEHPKVLELLQDTLGITVYQEQVSSILTNLAGFTIPEAEKARKIMSKKWKDKMVWVREKILKGMSASLVGECQLDRPEQYKYEKKELETYKREKENNSDLNQAEFEKISSLSPEKINAIETDLICENSKWTWAKEYWKRLETFARYSFNKSHALAYSLQVYRCLYLKTHYPAEWWSAVLNSCHSKKQPKYIRIAKSEGTKFGSLDINSLSKKFDVVDGKVVPGLLGIKGIGEKMVQKIDTNIRDIKDIDDFVDRQINNKTFLERAIHLGAFDKLHKNRKALWYWYLYKYGTNTEAKETRNKINKEFEYSEEEIEEIREQMYKEHKEKHPKSKKVPKRIKNYMPKPNPTREQVMGLECFEKDYPYKDRLRFQKEFLDYHWDSPMDMYGHKGGCTIEKAKTNGILECVVSTKEMRKSSNGNKFMTLMVTDGEDFARIQIWKDCIDEYGEDYFSPGAGLSLKVSYNETYKSFNIGRDKVIKSLPKIDEIEKIQEYMSDTEIFPELEEFEGLENDI